MRQEKRGNATASPLWPEIGAEVEADVASQAQKDSDLDLGFAESTLFKLLYFSFYSSAGVLFPYYALFFQSKGFSKSAIGMLCMIPNMTSFIFAPLINYFADKWKRNFEVMHISLLLSGVLNFVLLYFSDSLTTVTILVFLSSIVKCPVSPLIDSMVVSSLKDASDYGHMRQFGAMSFGIFSLGGGIMLTVGHEWSFPLLFILATTFFITTSIVIFMIQKRRNKYGTSAIINEAAESLGSQKVSKTAQYSITEWISNNLASIMIFSLIVLSSGIGSGVIDAFLFVRLEEIGGNGILCGISRLITCISEVPFFQVAGPLQKRIGTFNTLALCQLAFVIRFYYYSVLTDPWYVLPAEILHGFTFAVNWNTSVVFADEIAPPEMHSTIQSILESIHWGLGSGAGAFVAGILYDRYGAVFVFQCCALLALIGVVFALIASYFVEGLDRNMDKNTSANISKDIEFNKISVEDEDIVDFVQ